MIIIQDTREQIPWDFTFFGADQKVKKLDTGDYSLEGLEDKFCIERKMSTGEIAINLGSKNKTFVKELDRMMEFEYKFLICEFSIKTLLSFPVFSGIPKDKLKFVRMNANYLVSLLGKYEDKYGLEVIYCNDKNEATNIAYDIMKEVYAKSN
jgi:ERCC4-type nuclease